MVEKNSERLAVNFAAESVSTASGAHICRLLPYSIHDGVFNMAADELLLREALSGRAALRFYGWSAPTLSLGYFQSAAVRFTNPVWQSLPWVRRPSGGATLIHQYELTYALALPPGPPWRSGVSWLPRMHSIIVAALAELGVSCTLAPTIGSAIPRANAPDLCFLRPTAGDILCGGSKIVGSAQRKIRQALLQHGGVLLATSEFAPGLPGIAELAGISLKATAVSLAIEKHIRKETGWVFATSAWTDEEITKIEELAREKYGLAAWNEKR